MTLDILFYCVIVLSMICYAMLDGFDLGVGILYLFAKKDEERRVFLNAIGPVWDGNEVWLVIVVGALFAGFPAVYATILSTFYIPTMLFLVGLIMRAVSIEFRSKRESNVWRQTWDMIFAAGSLGIAFGVGVALGTIIQGIPLDENRMFVGTLKDFVTPYAILIGTTTVALFTMHGAIFLVMKTEGELHDRIKKWVPVTIVFFIYTYLLTTYTTLYDKAYMISHMLERPYLFVVPLIGFIAILSVPLLLKKGRDGWAFISSCLSIALLLSLAAIGTFPYMVRSTIDLEKNSLVISNSASSELTLKILLIIVAIGVPLVLGYGFYIYRTFRGKVKIDTHSY
ncbi:MAG: cytochrome d ubiquinol oxidase subunit II [Verrucomicrobia bacterium]|nr:cytochrome d ubiquinol oxidase subunit II [Verrucomicrobiota bacterium]